MKGRKPKQKQAATTGGNITSEAPEWLNPLAREIWEITIERVHAAGGIIPERFTEIYTGYCQCAAAAREADEVLSRDGMTVCDGRAGTRRHPLISVRSQALLQLRGYAESLGLTLASQNRLPTTAHNPADHAASEEIRRNDPQGYARYLEEHGRPPTNPFEML